MDIFMSVINTVILVALFWYQKNKNKVLVDRISEQSNLLNETKDVVLNQAQAIESQKRVVETALQYTSNFDVSKVESIIKREIELDYKEKIQEQETKISHQEQKLGKATEAMKKVIMESTKELTASYIVPLSSEIYSLMLTAPREKREQVLSKLPESIAETMRSSLVDFDKNSPLLLTGLLSTNNIIQPTTNASAD
ncbi:hypothetical protein [Arsukibacterium sp. UBA3155]|uniref:hypothetical protein n=1 Tax=Arsukibacterium sp. UBA3155 TaxID=1946058 RepID=UPI0025C397A0|nr:hypothetical protein [Arsukibacterium sp. UBA3155]|tara:strand:+ start:134341 stop:134928 length:588 start_codon:yes stop_codon:yes gene_type:complete